MKDNSKELTITDAAEYAVNAIAHFCTQLGKEGVPAPLIVYALNLNHAMAVKVVLDASFAALKSEQSEGPKGG